jgi:hypothetical protein
MRSAFALRLRRDSLRAWLAEPKLARVPASEGWTTDMFVEAIYNSLKK